MGRLVLAEDVRRIVVDSIADALDAAHQHGVDEGIALLLSGLEVGSLEDLRALVGRARTKPVIDVVEHDPFAGELVLYVSHPVDPRVGFREYRSYRVGSGAAVISIFPLHEAQR